SSQAAASYSTTTTGTSSVAATGAIGGHRDLLVQLTSKYGDAALGANTDVPNTLEFSTGPVSTAVLRAVWDGTGGNAQSPNYSGLNHFDLTSAGVSTGIDLTIGADHDNATAVLKIYSDANDWSSATVNIPNTGDGSAGPDIFVPFSSFVSGGGSGANFSSVGAVQLDINATAASDGILGSINAAGPKVFSHNFADEAQADLAIVKAETPNPAVAGGQLTYTLTTTNNGPSNATGVIATDTLPLGLTYKSSTSTQGSVINDNGALTVNIGNLANGAGATTTIVATIDANASGTLTNTAVVKGNETDPNLANNTSTVNTPLTAEADLAIVKTASASSVIAGKQLSYSLAISNNGPSNATGVTVHDPLPSGETFVSGNAGQGTVTATGNVVSVNVGNLANGASTTTTILVNVASTAVGTLTNTATVKGNETDPNLGNNTSTVNTTVEVPAPPQGNPDVDLAIVKTAQPNPVAIGGTLTYSLVVRNNGPATATTVNVADTLPAWVTYSYATSTLGTASYSNGTVSLSTGSLASGGQFTITIVGTVNAGAPSSFTNTATVSDPSQIDSNLSNNTSSVVTDVIQPTPSKWWFIS
ncbi:MAG: DUF11 domain-containing protein, partial [Thermoguttaceae bacterium]